MSKQAIRFDILSRWIACILCYFFSCVSYADLLIDEQFTEQRLAPEISYVCDGISKQTLDEVKALNFVPLTRKEISFSFTQSNCWFHFRAFNNTNKPLELVLSSDFNAFDHIDFYIPSSKNIIVKSIGDSIPYSQRELKLRTLAIPFIINALEKKMIIIYMLKRRVHFIYHSI